MDESLKSICRLPERLSDRTQKRWKIFLSGLDIKTSAVFTERMYEKEMSDEDYRAIWRDIFARHRALVKFSSKCHTWTHFNMVNQATCNCIQVILELHGRDIEGRLMAGKSLNGLSSKNRQEIRNFKKKRR